MRILGPLQIHGSQPGRSFLASLKKSAYPFIQGLDQSSGIMLPKEGKIGLISLGNLSVKEETSFGGVSLEIFQASFVDGAILGLSRGGMLYRSSPTPLETPIKGFKKIFGRGPSVYALNSSNELWDVSAGKLVSDKTIDFSLSPTHLLVLREDGFLWGQGSNQFGQLGATEKELLSLQPLPLKDCFIHVVCGTYHSSGIKKDGTLWAWGNNDYGQLGDGTMVSRYNPVICHLEEPLIQISSSLHNLGLDQNGQLWAWGCNHYGQLGLGDSEDRLTPQRIHGFYTSAYSAYAHSLLLDQEGELFFCGLSSVGSALNEPRSLAWESK